MARTEGNDEWKRQQMLRQQSFFPAVSPRFAGALQPSPNTGSYYNPARYANQGFSRPELNRIQKNLSNVYNQDLQYNRVANPQYQTTQDTGYGSFDQFGSGRASPATTQNYALQYGTPTGNGLSTFQTPSGGSITYRPSGRTLSGGAQPNVSPFGDVLGPSNRAAAYAKGYGTPNPITQPGPGGNYVNQGGVMNPTGASNPVSSFFSGVSNLYGGTKMALSKLGFGGGYQPIQPTQQSQDYYAYNPSPVPRQPNRYFDF